MSLENLVRWGGLAASVGGVLSIAAEVLVPSFGPPSMTADGSTSREATVLMSVLWGSFVFAGLAGLCASVMGRLAEDECRGF